MMQIRRGYIEVIQDKLIQLADQTLIRQIVRDAAFSRYRQWL